MRSNIPKPLHTISGKTMLQWVIDANQSAGIKKSIIVAPQEFDKFDIKNKNVIKTIQKKTKSKWRWSTKRRYIAW